MENDKKLNFEELTPVDNVDLQVYEQAIDFIFKNESIKNVAISGPYSAGKSSVLASYKKKHNYKKFIHISLAHFEETEIEDKKTSEKILEGKILNQLVHQIPIEQIPGTNFKVKREAKKKDVIITSGMILLFVIALLHSFFFSEWSSYVTSLSQNCIKCVLMSSTNKYALLINGIVVFILAGIFIYQIITLQTLFDLLFLARNSPF